MSTPEVGGEARCSSCAGVLPRHWAWCPTLAVITPSDGSKAVFFKFDDRMLDEIRRIVREELLAHDAGYQGTNQRAK